MRSLLIVLISFLYLNVSAKITGEHFCQQLKQDDSDCICIFQGNLTVSNCRASVSRPSFNLAWIPTCPDYSSCLFQILITSSKWFSFDIAEIRNESYGVKEVSLLVENVYDVAFGTKSFNQIVVHGVFKNVTNLSLAEKSFYSCWGSILLMNTTLSSSMELRAISSSDIIVWHGLHTTNIERIVHRRPELTPLQKATTLHYLVYKLQDLEITIYALLALCAFIVLCLIILAVCAFKKNETTPRRNEIDDHKNLPDVVPSKEMPRAKKKKAKGPVIKVSRISKVFHGNNKDERLGNRSNSNGINNARIPPRPPLPAPKMFKQYEV